MYCLLIWSLKKKHIFEVHTFSLKFKLLSKYVINYYKIIFLYPLTTINKHRYICLHYNIIFIASEKW